MKSYPALKKVQLCKLALLCSGAALLIPTAGLAQTNAVQQPAEAVSSDAIIVEGIRATQRSSLETKRKSNLIVDALVSDEIGATPDQSVGETLERIVGVTADRFKGSASEISIRGLGPFLGFSTLNGREVTSGSGDRAVSFQQFPSELVNGVIVYKSQNASLVEGGSSGVVELRTLRPLDFGKQRITADVRAVYEEYDDKITGRNGLGYRGSLSYVDQFKLGDGELGVSIGYSKSDEAAPEDFYTESSTTSVCNSVNASPFTSGTRCGYSAASTNPKYFVQNSYLFRQSNNDLTRDAVIASLQYKPSPELDINIDGQYSRRDWVEDRSDIVIAERQRGIQPLVIATDGSLLAFNGNSRLEQQSRLRTRDEDYYGGGASIEWTDDAVKVGLDVSYSQTDRLQIDRLTRLRTAQRIAFNVDKTSGFPIWTFQPNIADPAARFDLSNHDNFADVSNGASYARRDQEKRTDKVFAVALNGEAFIDSGFFTSIQGGLRFSDHQRVADLANQNRFNLGNDAASDALIIAANQNCRVDFRQSGYFGDVATPPAQWAQFDPLCVFNTFTGTNDNGPAADSRSLGDVNVTERIMAGYAMANFANESGTIRGNVGVRIINTDVTSKGFRAQFSVDSTGGVFTVSEIPGSIREIVRKNSFVSVLPSINLTFEAAPDFLIRAAAYKAISRPNIEDMNAGRDINSDAPADAPTLQDAIANTSGGNPFLEPLETLNADLSFEWYPSKDNAITAALFYKQLSAGLAPGNPTANLETFIIGGNTVDLPVGYLTNSNDKKDLWGFEVTLNHSFSYLPGLLSGFGVIAGYSYADSNFEYPDPASGNNGQAISDFTTPGNIIGLSKHTLSASAYYEKGPISVRGIYKYRSDYLKPFQLAANRYALNQQQFDASISLKINKNIELRLQGLNLTNTADTLARPTPLSISEISRSGRKFYAGVKLRF